jgi:alpha-galactosidase
MENEQRSLRWGHEALHLEFVLGDDGSARLTHLGLPGEAGSDPPASLPLVEVTAAGHGRGWSGSRLIGTALGGRLRHRAHHAARDGDWHTLTVDLHDPETGLVAEVTYRSPDGVPVLRSEVTLRNEGHTTLHLGSVSSLVVGCLARELAAEFGDLAAQCGDLPLLRAELLDEGCELCRNILEHPLGLEDFV